MGRDTAQSLKLFFIPPSSEEGATPLFYVLSKGKNSPETIDNPTLLQM